MASSYYSKRANELAEEALTLVNDTDVFDSSRNIETAKVLASLSNTYATLHAARATSPVSLEKGRND